MSFVYVAPYVPPMPTPPAWGHLPMTWTGWDGTVWDLCSGESGVVLGAGVRGMNMPPTKRHTTQSPAVAGSRRRGWGTDEREVFWPIRVFKDTNATDWVELDAAFWHTMHPDKAGVWSVTGPKGVRSLTCVYDNDGGHSMDMMPTLRGWEKYGIYLAAEQPYWSGDPVRRTWAQSAPVDFFGGVNKAPIFHISSGSSLATAAMTNEGDVDAWPVWSITGPATSVTVGVGGRTVTAPFTIAEGSTLVIDSDPAKRSALLDGASVYKQLSSWNFAPIPPGRNMELSLSMAGTGSVMAEITPRYFRSW